MSRLSGQSAAVSGRDFLVHLMETDGSAPFGLLLGFQLTAVGDGEVTFEGTPDETHYNPQGIVHGGYAAAVIDSALGCAVQTRLGKGVTYSTVELTVNFIRAMTALTGPVKCTGTVVHVGRRMATAQARMLDARAKLIAHGSATLMIHDRKTG